MEASLSDERSELSSKKDAIRKYEAMGTSPTRCAAFRVKKTNWDGRKDSPIAKFPNGMSGLLPIVLRYIIEAST